MMQAGKLWMLALSLSRVLDTSVCSVVVTVTTALGSTWCRQAVALKTHHLGYSELCC